MKRLFRLTSEAKSDLREILLDIAEDGPETAERLRSEFYQSLYRSWNSHSHAIAHAWEASSDAAAAQPGAQLSYNPIRKSVQFDSSRRS